MFVMHKNQESISKFAENYIKTQYIWREGIVKMHICYKIF